LQLRHEFEWAVQVWRFLRSIRRRFGSGAPGLSPVFRAASSWSRRGRTTARLPETRDRSRSPPDASPPDANRRGSLLRPGSDSGPLGAPLRRTV